MITFSAYWEQWHFFLGTPNNPSLFLVGMAEKMETMILYRQILSSKRRAKYTTMWKWLKVSKKKGLFPAISQVVIQSMDSSAHYSTIFLWWATLWALCSSGGYFCERNACASLSSAAKSIAAHRKPSEIRYSVTIRGDENTSVRSSRHSLNFGHRCQTIFLHVDNLECRAEKNATTVPKI